MFTPSRITADLIRAHRAIGIAKRPRGRLPRQQYPKALESEYARAVTAYIVPRIKAAFAPLYAALPGLLAAARHDWRADAGVRKAQEMIDEARDRLRSSVRTTEIDALAQQFARKVSTHQRIQLARQTKAALGVDVVAHDRTVPALIENFAANNVALIKDIGNSVAAKTELAVSRAIADGTLHGDLAEELKTIGYGETRAALIARDQIGKLSGQINAVRQKELGATRFTWRTVGDERVRDAHDEIDGDEFEYNAGGHPTEGLPGEAILCRCYAEPIFDDILDEASADDS